MGSRSSTRKTQVIDLEDDAFSDAPTSVKGSTKKEPISVEQYSEEKALFLAMESSLSSLIDLDSDSDLQMLDARRPNTSFPRRKPPFTHPSVTEPGGSSNSKPDPPFVCAICTDTKPASDSFAVPGCSHAYCGDCVARYIESKLDEKTAEISCPEPNCKGSLQPENCRRTITKTMFDRWGEVLAEALISEFKKLYCPYRDCSAVMVDDGGENVRESECMNCNRLFCAQCNVPWHAGIGCEEFQKFDKNEREREDIMLKKLAEEKKWTRCPKCGYYVDKVDGCVYVKCRCLLEDVLMYYLSPTLVVPFPSYFVKEMPQPGWTDGVSSLRKSKQHASDQTEKCQTAFCHQCGNASVDATHYCRICKRTY